jgi:putative heme-binding domain-containing protein
MNSGSREKNPPKGGGTTFPTSILLIAAITGVVASASSRAQVPAKFSDPQSVAEGATLFAPTCGTGYCHGSGGSGGGAPKLRGRGLDANYLFRTISNGISGTPMIPFKSQYTEDQMWKLVAFILSDAPGSVAASPPSAASISTKSPGEPVRGASSSIIGDAKTGRLLFFDSESKSNCSLCHSFEGEGASVGPDLSKIGERLSAQEIFAEIAMPNHSNGSPYETVRVTLKSGETLRGLKKEEDSDSIRVYDTTELPPVLRTIQKSDIGKLETVNESVMPKDYASRYTLKQLLDIVTCLKSADSRDPVTLEEILNKR